MRQWSIILITKYSPVLLISRKLLPHSFKSFIRHHSEKLIQFNSILSSCTVNLVFISFSQVFDQLNSLSRGTESVALKKTFFDISKKIELISVCQCGAQDFFRFCPLYKKGKTCDFFFFIVSKNVIDFVCFLSYLCLHFNLTYCIFYFLCLSGKIMYRADLSLYILPLALGLPGSAS